MNDARVPVVVLDHIGYRWYQQAGRRFLPAEDFEVRLVTDLRHIAQATGDEVAVAIGVRRGDGNALEDAAAFLSRHGGRKAAYVTAITESLVLSAARLRDRLGVAGPTEQEVLSYRDKVTMKRHLRERGIRVPDFAPLTEESVRVMLGRHGRIVLKPRLGQGSVGVLVTDEEDEALRLVREVAAGPEDYDVEEFIDGELYHIDSVVRDGVPLAALAGHSVDDTANYRRLLPYRDVGVAEGPLLDQLLTFNREVLACYPRLSGVTHHEVFVTDGGVCFCEIAGRPGGGGIIPGFVSRIGVNLDEMTVRSQVGLPIPDLAPPAPHLTGYAMIYAPPGRLRSDLLVPEEPWIVDADYRFAAGDVVSAPRHWGQAAVVVTVRGDTEQEVGARLETSIKFVEDQYETAIVATAGQ